MSHEPSHPELPPYLAARLRARAMRNALDQRAVLEIHRALRTYIDELERLLRARFPDRLVRSGVLLEDILEETIRVNELAARRLLRALLTAIEERRLVTFEQILEIWERAGRDAAARIAGAGLVGAVRAAPVTMMGTYASANAASTWQTLIRGHVGNAATEVNRIVQGALLEGVGADELSRRLRRYVVGSESFDTAFENVRTLSGDLAKIDLRKLTGPERDAARQMEWNARRIAVTEMGNARREAEVQHGIEDPMIIAWRWVLSPNRGPHAEVPDSCDYLASVDWYGLGPGVHPYDKVPTEGHPLGKCEIQSVARSISQINEAKESADRIVRVRDIEIPEEDANGRKITDARRARIIAETRAAIRFGELAVERAA